MKSSYLFPVMHAGLYYVQVVLIVRIIKIKSLSLCIRFASKFIEFSKFYQIRFVLT